MSGGYRIEGRWRPATIGEMNGNRSFFMKQVVLCSRWQVPPDFLEANKSELSPTLYGAEIKYALPVIRTIEGNILSSDRA